MRIFINLFSLIYFNIYFKNTFSQTVSNDDIKRCTSLIRRFCYGRCVDTQANCAFWQYSNNFKRNVCLMIQINIQSESFYVNVGSFFELMVCEKIENDIPGYFYGANGYLQDCRSEENCLTICGGFWNWELKICLRQTHKSFKYQNSGIFCNTFTTQKDCIQCKDQQYTFYDGKCVKCPYGKWNTTTMTCSVVSTCNSSFTDKTCIQCPEGMGVDSASNTCVVCLQFNADYNFLCDFMALKFCKIKSSDNSYCLQCQSADQVYDVILKYCVCAQGKSQNMSTGECTKCSDKFSNCAICTSSQCTKCQDPNQVLSVDSKSCICPGYMAGGQCYLCTYSLPNCQTCNSTGTKCILCQQYYGLYIFSDTCYSCSSVDKNCISCDGLKNCTQCTNGYFLDVVNNKCVCDTTGSTKVLLNGICNTCQNAINSCNKCQVNDSNNGLICNECKSLYVPVNGICQLCADGYYKQGNNCFACTVFNCKACTATDCFTCKTGFKLSNNSCNCIYPMIIDSDGVCKTCESIFGSLCSSCSVSTCITCSSPNYTANTSGCQCLRGVIDIANFKCYICPQNCSTCSGNADFTTINCTQCDDKYKLLSDNTCGQCTATQYYNSATKTCNSCNSNCSGCPDNSSGGSCSGCLHGFILNNGVCQCIGSKVLSTDGVNCIDCYSKYDVKCATCDSTSCLTCQTNYFYIQSSKVCITCSEGQYYEQSATSCTKCSSKCTKCTNLTGACTECTENYNLNSQSGVCECTTTKVLNSQNVCVLCSVHLPNCNICSSLSTCLSCTGSYKIMSNGTCQKCLEGQYYNSSSRNCQQCPMNCISCSDDTALCTESCNNNYRLESGACVCTKDRLLKDNICTSCKCNDTECQVCDPPYIITHEGCTPCKNNEIYKVDSKSCVPCKYFIKNCKSCLLNISCTSCNTKFKLSDDLKSCTCPAGNYLIAASKEVSDDQCISCKNFDKQCLTCSSENVCTSCTDGYEVDSSSKICRQCKSNEVYTINSSDQIQKCVDCNIVHSKCIQCFDISTCLKCTDNYDLNPDHSCQCAGNKVLVPNPNNSNQTICKLCSETVGPLCLICISPTQCSKCILNYRLELTRCVPDIIISITSSKQNSNTALGDTYNMSIIIPSYFTSAALKITIHFFDSIENYNTEVNSLKSNNVANEDIPFSFNNSVIFTQDNLKTLPHPKYTNVNNEDGLTFLLKRFDNFVLHEGKLRFVFAVESQIDSFVRYSNKIDITTARVYKNMKDLSFAMGQQLSIFSSFSLYQIFFQINIHKNEICTTDEQCSRNGTCQKYDKLCKCNSEFQLFDCSDYITFTYDSILEKIGKTFIVSNPVSFQEKLVSKQLSLLTTSTTNVNKSVLTANLNAIQDIIKNDIIDNFKHEILKNLMQNAMNTVSQNIKQIGTGFTQEDVFKTIKQLEDITVKLLVNFDNKVDFTTSEMQLLAKIDHDETKLIDYVNVKNVFDVNYDIDGALFEPTTIVSIGLQIRMLRFSFKINPHKLSSQYFKDQSRYYPLVIYYVSGQNSTINNKRFLQSNAPLLSYSMNITFIFEVNNPSSLTNLICLSLKNLDSDQYILCPNIKTLNSQVICTCENSATLYEDFNYNYLQKPEKIEKEQKAPLSMLITIIVLSILILLLIIVQIRGRNNNTSSAKLEEAYAKIRADAITVRKRWYETEQNPMNIELNEIRKTIQESECPTHGFADSKAEDYRNYDIIFQQSPVFNPKRNIKLIIGDNEDAEPDGYYDIPKLDFYNTDQNQKAVENDIESETLQKPKIDVNMITPAMVQKFNDSNLENKNQRGSIMFDESEAQTKGIEESQKYIDNKKPSIIKFNQDED